MLFVTEVVYFTFNRCILFCFAFGLRTLIGFKKKKKMNVYPRNYRNLVLVLPTGWNCCARFYNREYNTRENRIRWCIRWWKEKFKTSWSSDDILICANIMRARSIQVCDWRKSVHGRICIYHVYSDVCVLIMFRTHTNMEPQQYINENVILYFVGS